MYNTDNQLIIDTIIKFQFHKGTIRTQFRSLNESRCTYFNSIKVQLELPNIQITDLLSKLFQFHKGTIRTADDYKLSALLQYFNSIKVQLEQAIEDYNIAYS